MERSQTKVDQCFVQTICDSIDLINETLISELCGQRSKKVDVAVEEEKRVKYRQDLILGTSKLPLHPHHHISYMLKTNKMQSSDNSEDKYLKPLSCVHGCVCKCMCEFMCVVYVHMCVCF